VITSGTLSREFLGRSAELEHLLDRALRSRSFRSAGVVVRGHAGIGKTRLVDELATAAERAGARIGIGRASEFANAPYLALADALRPLGVTIDAEAFSAVSKAKHFEAVAEAVAAAARADGPIVVVVDDLHWADSGTIELLRFLVTRLASVPVLFAAVYRNDVLDVDAARIAALAALEREAGDVVVLEPLPDAVIEGIIDSALGDERARVPAETIARLVELSEGRPFFAEELLRGVLERLARNSSAEPTVPANILASVRERFAGLSDDDRNVLLYAAVIGRRFGARFLIALLEMPPATVFGALRRARDLQLVIEEDDEEGDRFAFRHALTREAVYAELLRAEARILHGQVAEKLVRFEPVDIAAAAEHFWRAGNPSAALWNERAGAAAASVHSYADAIVHFERAFKVADDPALRASLAERTAAALYALGETERSAEWYASAADEYERAGELRRTWRLRLRQARILVELGHYHDGLTGALQVASAEDGDVDLRFEADVMVAGLLVGTGRVDEALERLERAAELGANPDRHVQGRYLGTLAYTHSSLRQPAQARRYFLQALEQARAIGDTDLHGRTLGNYGLFELAYGHLDTARAIFRDGAVAAETDNDRSNIVILGQNLSLTALLAGDLDEARQWWARASRIENGVARSRRWGRALGYRCAVLSGEPERVLRTSVREDLDVAMRDDDLESAAPAAAALAYALALDGDVAEASHVIGRVVAVLDRVEPPYWIIDMATRYGERLVRERAYQLIAAAAEPPEAIAARGALALAESRMALRARRREDAVRLAELAAAAFRSVGWVIDEAYALEAAGRTAEALAAFRRIGAHAEIKRLSGAVGTRQRGDATLTAREREIASLLAAGRTAREIADQLVISERTVETHVASVYRKLGVSNRRELSSLLVPSAGS